MNPGGSDGLVDPQSETANLDWATSPQVTPERLLIHFGPPAGFTSLDSSNADALPHQIGGRAGVLVRQALDAFSSIFEGHRFGPFPVPERRGSRDLRDISEAAMGALADRSASR